LSAKTSGGNGWIDMINGGECHTTGMKGGGLGTAVSIAGQAWDVDEKSIPVLGFRQPKLFNPGCPAFCPALTVPRLEVTGK